MYENLEMNFSDEYMAQAFPDIPSMQKFLSALACDRLKKQEMHVSKFADEIRDQSVHNRMLARKEQLETEIPVMKKEIDRGESQADYIKHLKQKLSKEEQELKELNIQLAQEAFQTGNFWIATQENEASIKIIDALAHHVLAWFRKGHLGAGTLEYNNEKHRVE